MRRHPIMNPSAPVAAAIALLFLASCAGLSKTYPERRFFDVRAAREGAPRDPAPATVLEIARFSVSPRYESTEIVRRTGDLAFESDYYDVFFVPPDAMATDEARNWLSRSGVFERVVDASSRAEETHLLEGNIAALYGDVRDGASPRAVFELQVLLLDRRADPPAVLVGKTYERSLPVADGTAGELAKGWSRALTEILGEVEEDAARAAGAP